MKVGVYVDAYNLYYGARAECGRSTSGWRWLDIRALVESIIRTQGAWQASHIEKIVYCTARVDARTNASAQADQDVYLKAIKASGSVDHIEYGNYVARVKPALLATEQIGGLPTLTTSDWPVMVRDANGAPVKDAQFLVSTLHNEEKGSDVNVASHLLIDVLTNQVDAAVVVTNDSDLALPVKEARIRIPVGVVNPRSSHTAGALMGSKTDGVGNHWWWRLSDRTYRRHQLPNPSSGYTRPQGW